MKKLSITFVFLTLSGILFAQNEDWEKNEQNVETLIYDVVGTTQIKLNPANRMYDPVPPHPVLKFDRNLSYDFNEIFYGASPVNIRLRPRAVAAEPEEKLYQSYVKAGFGNYMRPLLNVYLTNKRDREFSYGARFNWDHSFRGTVDKENSGEGLLDVGVFGEAYGDLATLYGDVNYSRFSTHFYGYPEGTDVEATNIRQHFSRFDVNGGVRNTTEEGDFEFDGKVGILHQSDNYEEKETQLKFDLNTTTEVIENIFVDAKGGFNYVTRNSPNVSSTRILTNGEVLGRFTKDNKRIYGGLRMGLNPDSLAGRKGLKFFPVGGIDISMNQKIGLFAKLYGEVMDQTWHSLSLENPYIESSSYVGNTINSLSIEGGIRGNIASWFGFTGGFKMSDYQNMPFFTNSALDQSRFEIVYDSGKMNILNPYIGFVMRKEGQFSLESRFDYFNYEMGLLEEAWNRPTYRLVLDGKFFIADKIGLGFQTGLLGGIMAERGAETIQLDPAVLLNLSVEYYTGSRFGIFMDLHNLLNGTYELYNYYPSKGFQATGGLIYKF